MVNAIYQTIRRDDDHDEDSASAYSNHDRHGRRSHSLTCREWSPRLWVFVGTFALVLWYGGYPSSPRDVSLHSNDGGAWSLSNATTSTLVEQNHPAGDDDVAAGTVSSIPEDYNNRSENSYSEAELNSSSNGEENKNEEESDGDDETLLVDPIAERSQEYSKEKLLVIHAGPGKTATTTLQVDWTSQDFHSCLQMDQYWYGGRYYAKAKMLDDSMDEGPPTFSTLLQIVREILIPPRVFDYKANYEYCTEDLQLQREQRQNQSESRQDSDPCWDIFRKQFDRDITQRNITHVLLSDEPLAMRWTAEHFQALKSAIPEDYRIVVVVDYRRFFEWLPASIYQRNRKRLRDTYWPNRGELQALEQLWPRMVSEWREHHYVFMDTVIDQTNLVDAIETRILDIHQSTIGSGDSVRTLFFCQILTNAPHCCEQSRRRDISQSSAPHWNTRTDDTVEHIYYDMIVTAAAQRGLIDKKRYERQSVRKALIAANVTLHMYCPNAHELEAFFQQSLDLERNYLWPSRAERMGLTSNTSEWEDQHRAHFYDSVNKTGFCTLDTEKMLRDAQIQRFFQHFSS